MRLKKIWEMIEINMKFFLFVRSLDLKKKKKMKLQVVIVRFCCDLIEYVYSLSIHETILIVSII